MAMIKMASAADWSQLADRPPLEVKVSSRGFLPGDSSKVAAEVGDRFIHEVRRIEDELDTENMKFAHAISCGAYEMYGPNANADAWDAKSLTEQLGTYTKHGKCYRDHYNKSDSPYYGRPKLAFYDPDRGYGRVLAGYFANDKSVKAEDDRNAKVADEECQMLSDGDEIKVSLGTHIKFDVCSMCGNESKTRKNYCKSASEGGDCSMFGCVTGLSKIAEDGRQQFVYNPNNVFFDISAIGLSKRAARQADRIAYAEAFDLGNTKESSEQIVAGSAALAEAMGIRPRYDFLTSDGLNSYQRRLVKTASRLVEHESSGHITTLFDDYDTDVSGLKALTSPSATNRHAAVVKLAFRDEFFGPRVFAKVHGLDAESADVVAKVSAEMLRSFCEEDVVADLVKVAGVLTAHAPDAVQLAVCDVQFPVGSLRANHASRRNKLAAMFGDDLIAESTRDASLTEAKVAAEYVAAKLAFFDRFWQS